MHLASHGFPAPSFDLRHEVLDHTSILLRDPLEAGEIDDQLSLRLRLGYDLGEKMNRGNGIHTGQFDEALGRDRSLSPLVPPQ